MRCEDCLPLIEEYFDGEVTGQTGERVSAHLAACADCSAALDALSFEQEIYARYDRGGLEVTPGLWARVSAEIARTPPATERPAAGRPFLSRAREYFAAALGALAVRPALASSLALLVVAAAAGTLWLALGTRPSAPAREIASQNPTTQPSAIIPAPPDAGEEENDPRRDNPLTPNAGIFVPVVNESLDAGAAQNLNAAQRDGDAELSLEQLLAESPAPKANPGIVVIGPAEHRGADETQPLPDPVAGPRNEVLTTDARLLDPEQKDVARHVERAQMLLRSIKNVSASEAGGADVAYEKDLSRKLLAENATLQLEAEVKGDKETKQVLDQIQPFLLEIANMGEKPSREEVRSIGERVRQNEIVAALEVY
jgi:hypothetical protein